MKIPRTLVDRFGEPKITQTGWVVFRVSKDWYTNEVVLWRPGMRTAIRKEGETTVEKIPVSEKDFLPYMMVTEEQGGQKDRADRMRAEAMRWKAPDTVYLDYLLGRGLTFEEVFRDWVVDSFRPDYVLAPLYEDGTLLSWHGRAVNEEVKRYISPEGGSGWLATTRTLWGLDRILPNDVAFVCQGIFDAYYFDHGVAQMHARVTREQAVKVLDRKPRAVVVVADNGDENIGETDPAIETTNTFRDLTSRPVEIRRPPGKYKDYGELVALGRRMS